VARREQSELLVGVASVMLRAVPSLPVLPAVAVLLVVLDLVFVTTWSGVAALLGALLLLEPLFLARDDEGPTSETPPRRRVLPSLEELSKLPAALGTLSRVRRYLLVLFGLFFILRLVALVLAFGHDATTDDATLLAMRTATRLYDGALALTGLLLAVLQAELHRLGRFALFLAHRPAILLLTSFAVMISIGVLLLMLPIAVTDPKHLSLVDALFTMTSAVCVNGLTANDFAGVYSDFGQVVTLVGIQLGGIGIMTIAALAVTFGRASIEQHAGLSATLEAKSLADLRSLVRTVVIYTFGLEALGALVLWLHWSNAPWLADESALWLAVFHSISAFCNAGFSLFSDGFVRFHGDVTTQLVVMVLVLTGGIGFTVLRELWARIVRFYRRRVLKQLLPWRRTPVGVKVALVTSGVLLLLGALGIGASEASGALGHLSPGQQALNATFMSTMTRSAGFNTIDMSQLAPATLFIAMLLMFVGGSPGSAAGGIKTNTLAVLLATLRAELRGRDPELFGRAIDPRTIRRAVAVVSLSVMFLAGVLLLLTVLEPHQPFLDLAFEAVSAVATAGLSVGVAAELGTAAKLVVTVTMFVGRVGPLTIAYAVGRDHVASTHRLASEDVMVG